MNEGEWCGQYLLQAPEKNKSLDEVIYSILVDPLLVSATFLSIAVVSTYILQATWGRMVNMFFYLEFIFSSILVG